MKTKGIHAKQFCWLYLSTAIPCILYAADIFFTPQRFVGKRPNTFGKPHQSSLSKLASTHRSAAILITGALKTTATDIVLTLANLPPFHLLVNKLQHGAALCLASLQPNHPLHKLEANAVSRLVKHHSTPLHDLMHRFDLQPTRMEKIQSVRHPTHWKPGFTTVIIPNKDKAMDNIAWDNPDIKVFTDVSGLNGNIRASAVLYRNNMRMASLQYKLGLYLTTLSMRERLPVSYSQLSSSPKRFLSVLLSSMSIVEPSSLHHY